MKLKTRLLISFITIIVGPLALFMILVFWLGFSRVHKLEREFGMEFSFEYVVNTVQAMNETTAKVYDEMSAQAREDPDVFLNFTYLQSLDEQLESRLSFLVMKKDGVLYYMEDQGSDEDLGELVNQLPDYGSADDDLKGNGVYIGGDKKAMIKQVDLDFFFGFKGSSYIVTTTASVMPEIRSMLTQLVLIILLALIITGALIMLWFYKGINTPILRLQEATRQIAEGNLDFTLKAEGHNEISELTRDFETMRQKLSQAEEEKRRYNNESRELISNISHDLKTPVTSIKGYVEGIMDGVADTPEKMDRYIRTIYAKANEMDRLINELTFYSRIDTNHIPYHFIRLNVEAYFNDCAEELEAELVMKKIDFRYEFLADNKTEIIADPEQLMRVISNIIGNSVKYMDKTVGEIWLRVLDAGDYIRVEIEDNGKGIDVKDLPSIFDRFYRTDASRNSSQGGSGIGLSIARKIIEDHNGKIWAESQPGNGTTILFMLRKG